MQVAFLTAHLVPVTRETSELGSGRKSHHHIGPHGHDTSYQLGSLVQTPYYARSTLSGPRVRNKGPARWICRITAHARRLTGDDSMANNTWDSHYMKWWIFSVISWPIRVRGLPFDGDPSGYVQILLSRRVQTAQERRRRFSQLCLGTSKSLSFLQSYSSEWCLSIVSPRSDHLPGPICPWQVPVGRMSHPPDL